MANKQCRRGTREGGGLCDCLSAAVTNANGSVHS